MVDHSIQDLSMVNGGESFIGFTERVGMDQVDHQTAIGLFTTALAGYQTDLAANCGVPIEDLHAGQRLMTATARVREVVIGE